MLTFGTVAQPAASRQACSGLKPSGLQEHKSWEQSTLVADGSTALPVLAVTNLLICNHSVGSAICVFKPLRLVYILSPLEVTMHVLLVESMHHT